MHGSSLLSEEADRGSFRLHPLIRHYVRNDVSPTDRRVCQDIALRAVHGSIAEEEVEQCSTVASSEQVRMRWVLAVAPHAVAVVRDQVEGREVVRTKEQKFLEVTEPVADVTVRALSWSGRAAEAEALCSSVVDFLCWEQTEEGTGACSSRLMGIFKRWRSALFTRRKVLEMITNKFRLERCRARISRGNFVGQ